MTVPSSDLVNENEGDARFELSLDQPSCLPITIVARPQVRPIPEATGKLKLLSMCL